MNKAWITGITVASVAGTGGAAFATMQASTQHDSVAAEALPVSVADTTATTVGSRSYEFQAGPAGVVRVSAEEGVLRIESALPTTGWTLVDYTSPATHVEARLTDGTQVITFVAEIVNGEVVASISGVPVPTVPATDPATTAATTPATQATTPATEETVTTPAPQPAVPAATTPESSEVATTAPAPATTSAPSGSHSATGGDDDGDEEHEADESEESHESHESEGEGEESDD